MLCLHWNRFHLRYWWLTGSCFVFWWAFVKSSCSFHFNSGYCYSVSLQNVEGGFLLQFIVTATICKNTKQRKKQKNKKKNDGRQIAQLAAIKALVQNISMRSHISERSSSSLTSPECGVWWDPVAGVVKRRQPSSLFGHVAFLQDDLSLPGGQLGLVIA